MNLEALMSTLSSRDNGGVADERVVNTGVRNKVRLKLVQVDIQCTIESQRRGDGADDLCNKSVEVLVARAGNIQVPSADVVDSLVVNQEGTVRVFNGAVGRQNSIVGLHDGRRGTGGRVNGELKLRLLAELGSQALEQEGAEAGTSATAKGVENQESLEGVAVVFM